MNIISASSFFKRAAPQRNLFKPAKQKRTGIFKRTKKLSNPMNIISTSGSIKRAAPQSNLFKPAKQKRVSIFKRTQKLSNPMSYDYVENVVVLPPDGQIRPVGIFKKIGKALKRAVTLPKKMNSVKDLKKVATLKNIVGVASSFILPGVGSLIVQAALTASDIVKAQEQNKKIKQAAALAKKKDEVAVVQLTESFKALKAESDKFRAARGLKPLTTKLPDIAKSTPEQIEAAFTTLQNDATAIYEAEQRAKTTSVRATFSAGSASSTTPGTVSSTNKILIYSGIAVVGLGALYFLTRKRK